MEMWLYFMSNVLFFALWEIISIEQRWLYWWGDVINEFTVNRGSPIHNPCHQCCIHVALDGIHDSLLKPSVHTRDFTWFWLFRADCRRLLRDHILIKSGAARCEVSATQKRQHSNEPSFPIYIIMLLPLLSHAYCSYHLLFQSLVQKPFTVRIWVKDEDITKVGTQLSFIVVILF